MTLYLDDGDVQLYHGDVCDVLASLPAGIAQTCVTSPPYWGLRDYGTGQWTGGDAACDHLGKPHSTQAGFNERYFGKPSGVDKQGDLREPFRDVCGRCGARRVDSQLGLEATPDEYVTRLVAVFREVWRVLRDDGTVWLNLGSSYFSDPAKGGSGPGGKNEARWSYGRAARHDARPHDTADKAPPGSHDPGSACPDLCDGCAVAQSNRIARTGRPRPEVDGPLEPTDRGTSPAGSAATSPAASPLAAQASTMPRSSPPPPGACSHCSNCGACLSVLRSSSRDARLCARMAVGTNGTAATASDGRNLGTDAEGMAWVNYTSKLKQKDMVPIPWMVAMALQQDGWYLRCDVIWSKPNPMPESVTDRPTKSHEYLFLLSKRPRYFMDADAIREPHVPSNAQRTTAHYDTAERYGAGNGGNGGLDALAARMRAGESAGRNRRSVWEVATEPFPEAHFATYPQALVRPCILAGTSERGECSACGSPWVRETSTEYENPGNRTTNGDRSLARRHETAGFSVRLEKRVETTGWRPSCSCSVSSDGTDFNVHAADRRPQTVLDPFIGSGTTALVARKHGRRCIGIDLAEPYLEIAARRTQQLSLFALEHAP